MLHIKQVTMPLYSANIITQGLFSHSIEAVQDYWPGGTQVVQKYKYNYTSEETQGSLPGVCTTKQDLMLAMTMVHFFLGYIARVSYAEWLTCFRAVYV